ncbi:carbohydrate porin [Microvirga sp. c23x22]|uniref:Carbohydrate porin n=1 Tax=Microvirga terricola TaxID=2719797 RepID=A0ABX0VAZ3_9HYPH|nr:carbohydrate porin [Microvirga terricola]
MASSLGPLGNLWGARTALEKAGVTSSFIYIGEVLGNSTGGMRQGTIYEGALQGILDADLDKLVGWHGASFHASAYQIHGHGLSRFYVGNLMSVSGIEALPSTRLYELWLEQKLGDKVALRVGQLGADTEFVISQYATLFLNTTFGFPSIMANDLPSGGPTYPLATPGVRLKLTPSDNVTILAGLFDGNPAGPGPNDPQRRNHTGLAFRTSDPPFVIGEVQYAYNQDKDAKGLPGTFKFGGWHHFGRFADQRFDIIGLPLADPRSSGRPNQLLGDSGVYVLIDQMLYRKEGTTDQGIGVFARASASPNDRNLVSFYIDGGLTWKGMIPGRENDTFGISFAYSRISDAARGFDRDVEFFTSIGRPIRSSEAVVEVTYQAEIVPGWTIQPDFQYVFRPGGNITNPRDPAAGRIKDAAVFGLRTTIRY